MTLLPHHARELYIESGIDPSIAARRGCFSADTAQVRALGFAESQCRPGMIFPQWTLAGVQVGHLIKPDEPRTDEKGKLLKYEAPFGSIPHFDLHPEARHLLQDVSIPLYFTEGNKKSDAAWSRGLLCISLQGVWAFLRDRLITPELDEIPLEGRIVRLAFDSDVTRKESVAEAFLRFAAALSRRGAKVEIVHFADSGQGGTKTGFDDYFVAGGTVEGLEALTKPWDGRGPGIWLRENEESDVATLRRQLAAARADKSALVHAILNPELTRAQLITAVAVASETLAKQTRGEVEANGKIVLSASEIADDWRSAPEKGERVASVNPKSGRRPRMARDRVGSLMAEAVGHELIRARPIKVERKHANGSVYKATDWVIDPIESLAAALNPWITYRLGDPKARKPRTIAKACPECGEVHPIRRVDYCTGCGAKVAERIIAPEPPTDAAGAASDDLSEARNDTQEPPSPPPVRNVRSFVGGTQPRGFSAPPDKSSEAPLWHDLTDAQADLFAASRVDSPHDAKQALQALEAELADIARDRGRAPVPKPSRTLIAGGARPEFAPDPHWSGD